VNTYDTTGTELVGDKVGTEFDVAQAPIAIPTMVGATAVMLGTLSCYADSTLSVVMGTIQVSVVKQYNSVDPGSPEVVQFTHEVYDTQQMLVETDTISYSLWENSTLTFFAATRQNSSLTLSVTLP
jgi:hypothetical protein